MKYSEAFSKLGYHLAAPRTDWSAENSSGVCLTLWRSEVDWVSRPISMDSRVRAGRLEDWSSKPGNTKRRIHLQSAVEKYDGWVDAIIVDGSSNSGVTKASVWNIQERKGLRWRVVYFDPDTGHFSVEAV
jgi:hypothetical protein